ncbi:MAG: elongation factor P--(R)-beta-lysine ligase [Lysobacteraceae bacterium]|nr:MAG: elongation factor P--(R)-beta-lysine ligase [Xanthomonadaceae bacterium]
MPINDQCIRWQPTAEFGARRLRADLYRYIRDYFSEQGVLEVETPLLSSAANSDPAIESITADAGGHCRYLRTSPEFPLKRLLCHHSSAIYELGKVFRASEQGSSHNPEFTMLEWYRPGWDHLQLADEVIELVSGSTKRSLNVQRLSYQDLFDDALGIDALDGKTDDIVAAAEKRGAPTGLNKQQALDYLLSAVIAPSFGNRQLTLITGFPAAQAALSRIDPNDARVCQRFELYVGSAELANGYHELTDPAEQARRFQSDQQTRQRNGQAVSVLDQRLIAALQAGLESCAGVAVGIDRWLMWLGGYDRIGQVLNFDWESA